MKNLFDNDYIKINDLAFRYGIITLLVLGILVIVLNILKKDYYYQNGISLMDKNKAVLMVDKEYINKFKDSSEIIINDIVMNYNIEKIEENDSTYYVDIKFDYEVDKINTSTYKIKFKRENYVSYFIRIIKGGK